MFFLLTQGLLTGAGDGTPPPPALPDGGGAAVRLPGLPGLPGIGDCVLRRNDDDEAMTAIILALLMRH
jgi:hypothetical protein